MRPVKNANINLFEKDDKERLIGEVPRHPIGVMFIIFNGLFLSTALLVGLYLTLRHQSNAAAVTGIDIDVNLNPFIIGFVSILLILIVLGSAIAIYVYTRNFMVLTDQKMVLILQRNIFARQVSQLSIGDVQDVTVDQNSILARMFHYGTIKIETAGEQANFMFPYAQDPFEASKVIVQAHEENLQLYGN